MNEGYEAGAWDFNLLLGKAKSVNPDVVYFVQQANGLGFKPRAFAGAAAGFTLPEFCRFVGDAAENVSSLTLWTPHVPYTGAKAYYSNYMRKFGSETDYHGAVRLAAALTVTGMSYFKGDELS